MTELINLIAGWIYIFFDYVIHLDVHLSEIVGEYGWQTYLILFIIVFWETGVVIWPFLPGDSLLFAAGSIAAMTNSPLNPFVLFFVLSAAAILGDTLNYWIGHYIGPKAFKKDGRFLKKKYLDKTSQFYDKYGAKTIVLARFVPIVRTFAPFVAGIGKMNYPRFLTFNVLGAILWNLIFIGAGYLFGNMEIVKNNFSLLIFAIIILSCLPIGIEFIMAKKNAIKTNETKK